MRWRNFNSAGSEFLLHVFVSDNRNFTADDRKNEGSANQMLVTFVLWMYSNCRIAQHRFRTRRCDRQISAAGCKRVLQVIQIAVHFLVLDFNVGQGSTSSRIPVDNFLAAVDQAFLVQLHEYLTYCLG